jgi:serine/threonine protein phosphatase 1
MADRIIAIGDIHGCSLALSILIEAIRPEPGDVIITLGDYINRGPDGPGVLNRLIALGRQCQLVPLLGNHEEILLSALRLSREAGCITVEDEVVPAQHLAFLKDCRDFYETANHLFVHANYLPHLPMEQQPKRFLRWEFLDRQTARPHCSGKTAIVGHTTQKSGEILDLGFLKCIDTWCCGGGWLTALETTTGQVWQVNEGGRLRTLSGGV